MLTQSEVVGFLSKGGLPQNEVYQILHACMSPSSIRQRLRADCVAVSDVYSKLSRGALPTEAQAKVRHFTACRRAQLTGMRHRSSRFIEN